MNKSMTAKYCAMLYYTRKQSPSRFYTTLHVITGSLAFIRGHGMYRYVILWSGLSLVGCHSQGHSVIYNNTITTFDEQQMIRVSGDTFVKLFNAQPGEETTVLPFAELEALCSQYAPNLAPTKNKYLFTDAMRKGFFSRFQSAMKTDYDKETYANMSTGFVSVAFDVCESAWQQKHA